MEFINLSDKALNLAGHIEGLKKLILLPDYSPARGALPTGSVAVFDKNKHKFSAGYLGPDIGCGMALARFERPIRDLEYLTFSIFEGLPDRGAGLGSIGGGNHFITFYEVENLYPEAFGLKKGEIVALVHTGSRQRGLEIFNKRLNGENYQREYGPIIDFGKANRSTIIRSIESLADSASRILWDEAHNTIEVADEGVIYRKGAVKLEEGNLSVIPSSFGGEAVIVKAKHSIKEINNSMCHGTGRRMSRGDAKLLEVDIQQLRKKVYIPAKISDRFLISEAPHCYRTLDEIIPKIEKYVSVVGVLKPKSYTV